MDNYHAADTMEKATAHVEAPKLLFPNMAFMLAGHKNQLLSFKFESGVCVIFCRINKIAKDIKAKTTYTPHGYCIFIYYWRF